MSDACYSARPNNRANALERIERLHLAKNTNDQYEYDSAVGFFKSVEREMRGMYNPLEPGKGMEGILSATPNLLNSIKSNDFFTPECILKEKRDEAAEISKQTGTTTLPTITSRSDAQDEAD